LFNYIFFQFRPDFGPFFRMTCLFLPSRPDFGPFFRTGAGSAQATKKPHMNAERSQKHKNIDMLAVAFAQRPMSIF
jgi:hypothetical protein